MEVLKFPHPSLFQVCKEVTVFGPELKVLLDTMWETMVIERGMGLSANQVGLDLRMFTMEAIPAGGQVVQKFYCVNPVISWQSAAKANMKEGCLSAPREMLVRSDRSVFLILDFQDETGKQCRVSLKGIYAVCAQHESEHLDGKAFISSPSIPKRLRLQLERKWGIR